MPADRFPILHARYGYGYARGRVRAGRIECRFESAGMHRAFGGRWVPLQADEVQRVTLSPLQNS